MLAGDAGGSAPLWSLTGSIALDRVGGWNTFSKKGWNDSLSSCLFSNNSFVCLSIPVRHPLGLFSVWKRYLLCFFLICCLLLSAHVRVKCYQSTANCSASGSSFSCCPGGHMIESSYPQWPLLPITWCCILCLGSWWLLPFDLYLHGPEAELQLHSFLASYCRSLELKSVREEFFLLDPPILLYNLPEGLCSHP